MPGDMKPAHRNLLLTLGLVEESMGKVAEKIPAALSTDAATAEPAVLAITAEMQSFVAADVVYTRRAAALIKQALDDHDIGGQTIQASSFIPNLGWLDASTVARRIHADAGRGAGAAASTQPAAPGLHGHGLLGVERRRRHARDRHQRGQPPAGELARDVQREVRQPGREQRGRRRGEGHDPRRGQDDHRAEDRRPDGAGPR